MQIKQNAKHVLSCYLYNWTGKDENNEGIYFNVNIWSIINDRKRSDFHQT